MARGRNVHPDAPPAPAKPGEPEIVTRHISVMLSPPELAERSREAAELMAERDHTEADYRAKAKAAGKLVAAMDVKLRDLNRTIVDGEETRPVRCEVRIDRRAGKADTVRLDTGDVVETRALTAAERQMEVPGS
jgi:hypothetical protein